MTLRGYFDDRLRDLQSQIVRMASVSNEMIERAIEAATTGNVSRAQEVIHQDDHVDDLEQKVIRETVLLVMREMPVARDLRVLTSTLGVIGEIEKIADDAVKLARRAITLGNRFPGELRTSLIEMGVASRRSLANATKLYTEYEPELAQTVIADDDTIDTLYTLACARIVDLMRQHPDRIEDYLSTMQMFHALEHIADRSVAVAKRLRLHYENFESDGVSES